MVTFHHSISRPLEISCTVDYKNSPGRPMVFCRRAARVPPPVPIIVFIDRTTIDQFHPKLEPVQFTICTFAHRTTLDPWGLVPLGQSQLDTQGVPSPRPPE
jgi:hypothetical protein